MTRQSRTFEFINRRVRSSFSLPKSGLFFNNLLIHSSWILSVHLARNKRAIASRVMHASVAYNCKHATGLITHVQFLSLGGELLQILQAPLINRILVVHQICKSDSTVSSDFVVRNVPVIQLFHQK